ncbi:MAG TPA: GDSL-type esterase/lipase family protein, partial [Gemmatimonadaceae bacterium]|nr:GDSL-type esterase/lipase family protein [Gemmatimonadaceae bacterium]
VDARRVGVEGVSRYGKAALVAAAFDPRFAMVLIGSSGKGGATLHRRVFGEAVESLAGSGQYHWMAANYLRYAAAEPASAARRIGDLPVDSHSLLALVAPRLAFVSYGIPERGDAKWLDQRGSFMAAVAAGPVFRLLGARDLGVGDDYMKAQLPPVNAGPIGGRLAWRQHDGGHTDHPNWKHFLRWADGHLGRPYTPAPPVPAAAAPASWPADRATPRTDSNSMLAHRQLLAKRSQGRIDVYFIGNSITRRWGATDYPQFLEHWKATFHGWNAANFGWGADRIEHMLWRLEQGELDDVHPKVIVVLAGTNNLGGRPGGAERVADVTRGLRALVDLARRKAPAATIVLTGIFPRTENPAAPGINAEIARINANLAAMADGRSIRYLDVTDRLIDRQGVLVPGMFADGLHPALPGYQVWADALTPVLTELLGPRKATDEAPPPTGDPSARRP